MSTLAEALAPKSDQLNADDLIAGPRTLKITGARIAKDDRQLRVILNYEGDNGKPWKPCKTMGRAMVMAWAVTDEKQLVGKSVRVFRDPTVKFGDQGEIGGIRISHMSHIDKAVNVKLTVSQGKKGMFTFNPLPTEVPAADDERAAAEEYVTTHLARVRGAADQDAIDAIRKRGATAVGKIQAAYPDLYQRVLRAYEDRAVEVAAYGCAEADHGDQNDGSAEA